MELARLDTILLAAAQQSVSLPNIKSIATIKAPSFTILRTFYANTRHGYRYILLTVDVFTKCAEIFVRKLQVMAVTFTSNDHY